MHRISSAGKEIDPRKAKGGGFVSLLNESWHQEQRNAEQRLPRSTQTLRNLDKESIHHRHATAGLIQLLDVPPSTPHKKESASKDNSVAAKIAASRRSSSLSSHLRSPKTTKQSTTATTTTNNSSGIQLSRNLRLQNLNHAVKQVATTSKSRRPSKTRRVKEGVKKMGANVRNLFNSSHTSISISSSRHNHLHHPPHGSHPDLLSTTRDSSSISNHHNNNSTRSRGRSRYSVRLLSRHSRGLPLDDDDDEEEEDQQGLLGAAPSDHRRHRARSRSLGVVGRLRRRSQERSQRRQRRRRHRSTEDRRRGQEARISSASADRQRSSSLESRPRHSAWMDAEETIQDTPDIDIDVDMDANLEGSMPSILHTAQTALDLSHQAKHVSKTDRFMELSERTQSTLNSSVPTSSGHHHNPSHNSNSQRSRHSTSYHSRSSETSSHSHSNRKSHHHNSKSKELPATLPEDHPWQDASSSHDASSSLAMFEVVPSSSLAKRRSQQAPMNLHHSDSQLVFPPSIVREKMMSATTTTSKGQKSGSQKKKSNRMSASDRTYLVRGREIMDPMPRVSKGSEHAKAKTSSKTMTHSMKSASERSCKQRTVLMNGDHDASQGKLTNASSTPRLKSNHDRAFAERPASNKRGSENDNVTPNPSRRSRSESKQRKKKMKSVSDTTHSLRRRTIDNDLEDMRVENNDYEAMNSLEYRIKMKQMQSASEKSHQLRSNKGIEEVPVVATAHEPKVSRASSRSRHSKRNGKMESRSDNTRIVGTAHTDTSQHEVGRSDRHRSSSRAKGKKLGSNSDRTEELRRIKIESNERKNQRREHMNNSISDFRALAVKENNKSEEDELDIPPLAPILSTPSSSKSVLEIAVGEEENDTGFLIPSPTSSLERNSNTSTQQKHNGLDQTLLLSTAKPQDSNHTRSTHDKNGRTASSNAVAAANDIVSAAAFVTHLLAQDDMGTRNNPPAKDGSNSKSMHARSSATKIDDPLAVANRRAGSKSSKGRRSQRLSRTNKGLRNRDERRRSKRSKDARTKRSTPVEALKSTRTSTRTKRVDQPRGRSTATRDQKDVVDQNLMVQVMQGDSHGGAVSAVPVPINVPLVDPLGSNSSHDHLQRSLETAIDDLVTIQQSLHRQSKTKNNRVRSSSVPPGPRVSSNDLSKSAHRGLMSPRRKTQKHLTKQSFREGLEGIELKGRNLASLSRGQVMALVANQKTAYNKVRKSESTEASFVPLLSMSKKKNVMELQRRTSRTNLAKKERTELDFFSDHIVVSRPKKNVRSYGAGEEEGHFDFFTTSFRGFDDAKFRGN